MPMTLVRAQALSPPFNFMIYLKENTFGRWYLLLVWLSWIKQQVRKVRASVSTVTPSITYLVLGQILSVVVKTTRTSSLGPQTPLITYLLPEENAFGS